MADLKASGQLYSWPDINRYYDTGNPSSKECPTKKEILALPHKGINWDSPDFNIYDDTYKSYGRLGINPDYIESIGENEGVPRSITPFGSNDILSKTVYRRYIEVKIFNQDEVIKVPKEGATLKFKVFIGFAEYLYPDFSSGNNLTFQKKKSFKFDNTFLYVSYRNTNGGISDEVADEYYKNKLTYSISPLVDEEGYFEITITINSNSTDSSRNFSKLYIGVFENKNSNDHLYGDIISTKFPTIEQEASIVTWEYNFFVQNSTFNFMALGGKTNPSILGITSNKQMYINGKPTDTTEFVDYTIDKELPSWLSINEANEQIAAENKTESSRTFSRIYTQNESRKKFTITYKQAAGVKTYGDVIVTPIAGIPDIPASGGTDTMFSYTYFQSWGWNGKIIGGGSIEGNGATVDTHNGTVIWNEAISGSNLGTTPKPRIKLGTRTLTLTFNGKSGTATEDVYQAANAVIKTTQGAWEVSIFANPSTFTEQGGTSQISASARAPRTNTWSSGATNAAEDATGIPTLSIPTPVTGFSLSDTTLMVAENTTPNDRSVVVRATMDEVYKEVTVTQSEYSVEWRYTFTTSTPTLNFDALGTTIMPNLNSYREKYINGSLVEGSTEDVPAVKDSTTGPIKEVSSSGITLSENTTTKTRTGTVIYKQVYSDKTLSIDCNQEAGTITTRDILQWNSGFGGPIIPSEGGSDTASIRSGYWDVINGKDTIFHPVKPQINDAPDYIEIELTLPTNGEVYNCKVTFNENTSLSERAPKFSFSYGGKTLNVTTLAQEAAAQTYEYTFEFTKTPEETMGALGGVISFGIKSQRQEYINGKPHGDPVDVEYQRTDLPNVTEILDITIPENKTRDIITHKFIWNQTGSSKRLEFVLKVDAATIEYHYFIDWQGSPVDLGNLPYKAFSTVFYTQISELVYINGKLDSSTLQRGYEPQIGFISEDGGNWASLKLEDIHYYDYTYVVSIEENTSSNPRSGRLILKTDIQEFGIPVYQQGAPTKVEYDLKWYISDRGSSLITDVNSYNLGEGGEADQVQCWLICDKITTVGTQVTRTPVATGLSDLVNYRPIYTNSEGEVSELIQDDGGSNDAVPNPNFTELQDRPNIYTIVIGSRSNEGVESEVISMNFDHKLMDGEVEIGDVPTFYWTVEPKPYSRIVEYQFRNSNGSGAGSILNESVEAEGGSVEIGIISYEAFLRDNKEFLRRYIKPDFTNDIPNGFSIIYYGQYPDKAYKFIIGALLENTSNEAKNIDLPFTNPDTGGIIHLYLTQKGLDFRTQVTCLLNNANNSQVPVDVDIASSDGTTDYQILQIDSSTELVSKGGSVNEINVLMPVLTSTHRRVDLILNNFVRDTYKLSDDSLTSSENLTIGALGGEADYGVSVTNTWEEADKYFNILINFLGSSDLLIEISYKQDLEYLPDVLLELNIEPKVDSDPSYHIAVHPRI